MPDHDPCGEWALSPERYEQLTTPFDPDLLPEVGPDCGDPDDYLEDTWDEDL